MANEPATAPEIAAGFVQRRQELLEKIASLEAIVKEHEAEIQKIEFELLPEIMYSWGVQEFKTPDFAVKLDKFFNASLSKENQQEGFDWLEENDHGDIIKTEVVLSFSKGELDTAKTVVTELSETYSRSVALERSVHHMTLASFGRELNAQGKQLPNCFTVYQGNKAHISINKDKGKDNGNSKQKKRR